MHPPLFASTTFPAEYFTLAKRVAPVVLLALFWCWETWRPFFGQREGRVRHAGHNLAIALFNTLILGLVFAFVTARVAGWSRQNQYGLLNALGFDEPIRFGLALVLLDGWMYVWHRANHTIAFLWRFHRMHHGDRHMDVTTATRFHLGEHLGAAVLRLGLIPLVGFEVWNLVVYDTLVIAITQFHHADVSIGRCDGWLRWLIADTVHAQGPPFGPASRNRLELLHGPVRLGPTLPVIPNAVRPEDTGVRSGRARPTRMANVVGNDEDPVRGARPDRRIGQTVPAAHPKSLLTLLS